MPTTSLVWGNAREFSAALLLMPERTLAASQSAVRTAAATLIREAKKNATNGGANGTGHPRVRTGRLRNSIVLTQQGPTGRWGWQATVAPTVVYARRIELGFHGTDSLGRNYDQRGYPYFGPAYDEMRRLAPDIYRAAWARAASGR